jgi:putative ABC transport system permease protein
MFDLYLFNVHGTGFGRSLWKSYNMIRNIIAIGIRTLVRNKIFSLINILGLSIGLACAMLIMTFVRQQMTFDRFHEQSDNIFCLQQVMDLGTGTYTTDRCGAACGPELVDAFPEISACVRITAPQEMLISYHQPDSAGDGHPTRKIFVENAILAVDSNFFSFFTFPSISGDLSSALSDPYSIILTRKAAEKYFGDEDPLDKSLILNTKYPFTVTAVLEDLPVNNSITFDFLINFSFLKVLDIASEGFDGNPYLTFLYLDDPSDAAGMDQKITEHLDQFQSDAVQAEQQLLSLKNYHMDGEGKGRLFTFVITLLGIIILAIACINFMNLSTARYLYRTREVGVRKVAGARRGQLIRQFLGETMIITFIAVNLSIFLVDLAIPVFNQHFGTQVSLQLRDPVFLVGLVVLFLITSLVAGSYPAFFLSSFNPVNVFSKAGGSKKKGKGIRKVLVVVQFLFAILFIITSLVNYQQFKLLNESLSSLETSNIIYFQSRGELNKKFSSMKQEILQLPGVVNVTSASFIPKFAESGELEWGLTADATNDIALLCRVGYDFTETFGMEMETGRFYSEDRPSDSAGAIIINQAVADALELSDPVGQTFYLSEDPYTIIGVIKNYSFNPLALSGNKVILPFSMDNTWVFVKTAGLNREQTIDHIGDIHEKYNPDYPFEHFYLDEFKDPVTKGMGLFKQIVYFFTLFGILISCLGLLGLSTFTIAQRTREIAIRKALGASNTRILRLLTLDFLKLILVSLAIAIPVSILLMRLLLQVFVERISMGPGLFLLTAGMVTVIALLTISFQAVYAARGNPANSLRYE